MIHSYNSIPEPATNSIRQITLHRFDTAMLVLWDYRGGIGGKWRKGELFGIASSTGLITS
jgi:hypothetical protein